MFTIKIKDTDVSFPVSYEELTFKQLYDLLNIQDSSNYECVRLLLGMEQEPFYNLPHDVYTALEAVLFKWVNNAPAFDLADAVDIEFNGIVYSLPENIGGESIAQYKDIEAQVQKLGQEVTNVKLMELYPIIVATYLQKIIEGEYSYQKSQKIAKEVWNCNGMKVLSYGNFFFANALRLKNSIKKTAQKPSSIACKKWQDSANLAKDLGLLTRLKNWWGNITNPKNKTQS